LEAVSSVSQWNERFTNIRKTSWVRGAYKPLILLQIHNFIL